MKKLLLSGTSGLVATVDDDDFIKLSTYKWFAQSNGSTTYASRTVRVDYKSKKIYMHRLILGVTDGTIHVDHVDGNGLNNQRSNLRLCTMGQNLANSRLLSTNTTGFKGIHWHEKLQKWRAQISENDKSKHIGVFEDPRLAALAYDEAAREQFGDFARTNGKLGNFWTPHWRVQHSPFCHWYGRTTPELGCLCPYEEEEDGTNDGLQ